MSEAQSDGTPPYILGSMLTCPVCGFAKNEVMPVDACQFFYECSHCRSRLRPNPGDCCVFCSFGSVKCPPRQRAPEQCCQPKKVRELGGGIHGSAGEMSAMRAPPRPWVGSSGSYTPAVGSPRTLATESAPLRPSTWATRQASYLLIVEIAIARGSQARSAQPTRIGLSPGRVACVMHGL